MPPRLQQHARDARRDYSELGSKDLSELKSYVKGLHRLAGLDRLSDVAVPPAQRVRGGGGGGRGRGVGLGRGWVAPLFGSVWRDGAAAHEGGNVWGGGAWLRTQVANPDLIWALGRRG